MPKNLLDEVTSSPEGLRLFQQERAIQELTELVCELLERDSVTRKELASRLGKTKGYITQLLDGRANMTIRTIADIFTALDQQLHFSAAPLSQGRHVTLLQSMATHWNTMQPWDARYQMPTTALKVAS